MSRIFQNVSSRRPPRNNFNLTNEVLLSGQIGKLIPVQCDVVAPGDKWDESVTSLVRFAPLSAPTMARFNVNFHSFFVPFRILTPRSSADSNWEKFVINMGESDLTKIPSLPSLYTSAGVPSEDFNGQFGGVLSGLDVRLTRPFTEIGSLWDYLGLPTVGKLEEGQTFQIPYVNRVSFLPFICYQMIWNYFYRRDQIETELFFPLDVGDIDVSDFRRNVNTTFKPNEDWDSAGNSISESYLILNQMFMLRDVNYERDYFTSALPEPQFGEDVMIGGDIVLTPGARMVLSAREPFEGYIYKEISLQNAEAAQWGPNNNQQAMLLGSSPNWPITSKFAPIADGSGGISLDVLDANGFSHGFSINELRLAMQLQGVREKINRGGTQYIEVMKSIYGIAPSDARLQHPQFLGGCKMPISIGSVIQTSESDKTPQGTLTGTGTAAGGQKLFRTKREFDEAGFVMTVMFIRPRVSYFGGIPKKFQMFDPIDFYTPDYDHLGEEEIKNSELYHNFTDTATEQAKGNETFGYTPRYSTYKSSYSTVHGEFRTTLDNWHVSREFYTYPPLNAQFIHADPSDFDRIFEFENIENTSNEHFYAQIILNKYVKRRMSKYSTPYTFGL